MSHSNHFPSLMKIDSSVMFPDQRNNQAVTLDTGADDKYIVSDLREGMDKKIKWMR
jgi:hypothetical protein